MPSEESTSASPIRRHAGKVALAATALTLGLVSAFALTSDTTAEQQTIQRKFCNEFVLNAEGASYHKKWKAHNPGEAQLWEAFKNGLCPEVSDPSPVAPNLATLYGKALVNAGEMVLIALAEEPPTTTTTTTTTTTDTTTDTTTTTTEPPDPTGFDIPAFNTMLLAGPGVGTNGRIGWWRQYKTANNSVVSHETNGEVPHLMTPAPHGREVSGPESWRWWLCGSITVPTNFPSVGRAFATINPHNSQYDVRDTPPTTAGIGWGYGNGVSPVHIFYISDGYVSPTNPDAIPNSFQLHVAPQGGNAKWDAVPSVQKGKRYDLCIDIIFGRLDKELGLAGPGIPGGGIGNHPNSGFGKVRVYVDGVLAVDTGNINTLHRAQHPTDGKFYTQTMVHRPWDGAYVVPGLSQNITIGRTMTRVGTTLADALADEPPHILHTEFGEGGGGHTSIAPLNSSDFRAPE